MAEEKRISGIDIDQDMDYQWREWRAHRVAWVVFAVIIVAALLGLLGQGPLSKGRAGEPGSSLALEWERIDRYQAPTDMQIAVGPNMAQNGEIRLLLNHEFMERIEFVSFLPEPASAETGAEGIMWVFQVSDAVQPARIRLNFEHEVIGRTLGQARLNDGPALPFDMFVLP